VQLNHFYDVIGSLGVILIIGAYFLLMIHRISSTDLIYSVMNAVGAILILFSLLYNFNFAAFLIEMFWLAISFIGIALAIRRRTNSHDKKLQT
jgi:hypothetical protein